MNEQLLIIESLLFVASEPLMQSDLTNIFDDSDIPSLDEIVLLEDSKHVPSNGNFKKIEDLIIGKN